MSLLKDEPKASLHFLDTDETSTFGADTQPGYDFQDFTTQQTQSQTATQMSTVRLNYKKKF